MPARIKNNCEIPLCPNLAEHGRYCSQHRNVNLSEGGSHKPRIDEPIEHLGNRTSMQFYKSIAWIRCRRFILSRAPLCKSCGDPATDIDHIKPIREGGEPFDPSNLQPLCKSCHARKTWGHDSEEKK